MFIIVIIIRNITIIITTIIITIIIIIIIIIIITHRQRSGHQAELVAQRGLLVAEQLSLLQVVVLALGVVHVVEETVIVRAEEPPQDDRARCAHHVDAEQLAVGAVADGDVRKVDVQVRVDEVAVLVLSCVQLVADAYTYK
jgi:hypothetical protein